MIFFVNFQTVIKIFFRKIHCVRDWYQRNLNVYLNDTLIITFGKVDFASKGDTEVLRFSFNEKKRGLLNKQKLSVESFLDVVKKKSWATK